MTDLKTFHISRSLIEETFAVRLIENHVVHLPNSYASVVELIAATEGLSYTSSLVHEVLHEIVMTGKLTTIAPTFTFTFTFNCRDGPLEVDYGKETLARHFLLIANYIEEYPEATSIDLDHHSIDVSSILDVLFEHDNDELDDEVLYALQTLTPVTDLYYLLFDLSLRSIDSFLSLLNCIPEVEKRQVVRSYQLQYQEELLQEESPPKRLELPSEGPLAWSLALETVRNYIAYKYVPVLAKSYPSFYFYNMATRMASEELPILRQHLLTSSFADDSGILHFDPDRQFLASFVLSCIEGASWAETGIILAMLGIKDPRLENEKVNRVLPYQVYPPRDRWITRDLWTKLRVSLTNLPLSVEEFEHTLRHFMLK